MIFHVNRIFVQPWREQQFPKVWYHSFKSNERCEYSYIGLGDFFFRESLKICSGSILIFRGLTCDLYQCISVEQQKCKGREKCDGLLISKIEINYQISRGNKSVIYLSSYLSFFSFLAFITFFQLSVCYVC